MLRSITFTKFITVDEFLAATRQDLPIGLAVLMPSRSHPGNCRSSVLATIYDYGLARPGPRMCPDEGCDLCPPGRVAISPAGPPPWLPVRVRPAYPSRWYGRVR